MKEIVWKFQNWRLYIYVWQIIILFVENVKLWGKKKKF